MKNYFKQDVIEKAIQLHSVEGRAPWKYKELTDKQLAILEKLIDKDSLSKIDRGAGRILISSFMTDQLDAQSYNFPYISDEDMGGRPF